MKVKRIIQERIMALLLAISYRSKKPCTSCQNHEEIKHLKAKVKRTTTKNKTNLMKQRRSKCWLRGYRDGLFTDNTRNARESETDEIPNAWTKKTVLVMANQD